MDRKKGKVRGTFLGVQQAAEFLGVSTSTLRNWDRNGRLVAERNPGNGYRQYRLAELEAFVDQRGNHAEGGDLDLTIPSEGGTDQVSPVSNKRVVSRLHEIHRDLDANSSIVERFDEITKILFSKLYSAGEGESLSSASQLKQWYRGFASENPKLVPKRFGRIKASTQTVAASLDTLNRYPLSLESDAAGLAYEEVIKRTFDKSDNQQFFTPPPVVDFMVDVTADWQEGVICDPASGTGGFLAKVAASRSGNNQLLGLEIDERLAWVTAINMLLHGGQPLESAFLSSGGSLGEAVEAYEGRVDLVLTNPPFGSETSDPQLLNRFALGRGRSSRRRGILFIEQCYRLLKPDGRVAIVIDDGVLNLPHAADVREFIREHFQIHGIVSLPESAFQPYASVKTSILVLQKCEAGNSGQTTFFGIAEAIGRKPNGDLDIAYRSDGLSEVRSDLPAIHASWREKTEDDQRVYLAQIASDEDRLDALFHHPARLETLDALGRGKFPLVPLDELTVEQRHSIVPAADRADEVIPYIGLAQIEPFIGQAHSEMVAANSLKSSVVECFGGDVLFSRMRPGLRKVYRVPEQQRAYASSECAVMSVIEGDTGEPIIDPTLLSVILRSDLVFGQIIHRIAGIGRPRISRRDLRSVLIPVPPLDIQREAIARIEQLEVERMGVEREIDTLRQARDQLRYRGVTEAVEIAAGLPAS